MSTRTRSVLVCWLALTALLVSACGPTPTPLPASATPTGAVAAPSATPQATATATSVPAPTALPTVTAVPLPTGGTPGVTFTLNPNSGPPGTAVTGEGFLPGGPTAAQATPEEGTATICWGDCPAGLSIGPVPVQWSATEAGHFTLQFTVPSIPWLAADGPHPLVPGDYSVGIQCLAPVKPGCLLEGAQVGAVFTLTGPTPSTCLQGPCGQLQLTPNQGMPGDLVQLGGWAPLSEIIDNVPFGYSLILEGSGQGYPIEIATAQQALDGSLSGSFRLPLAWPGVGLIAPGPQTFALEAIFNTSSSVVTETLPSGVQITPLPKEGGARVTLAPAGFTVLAAPGWDTLGQVQPLLFQDTARLYGSAMAFDAANPSRLAYCAPGGIQLSTDGGTTWSKVPTAGVANVVASGFSLFNPGGTGEPGCQSVTLDSAHVNSFFAVFQTAQTQYGAPPIYFMGFLTGDAGKTWKAVPLPQGYTVDQFGGFQAAGTGIQALFQGQATEPDSAPPYVVEQTTDGGKTWITAGLTCPSAGPCLTWGPAPSQVSGMGAGYPQFLQVSGDGGKTWSTPSWPTQAVLNGGPSELVALSATTVALVSAPDDFPFRVSTDGGQTWKVTSLPLMVGSDGTPPLYPWLQMLPNGTLLAQSPAGTGWELLQPGATAWCSAAGATLPSAADLFTVVGDRLWWVETSGTAGAAPTVGSTLVADLRCGP